MLYTIKKGCHYGWHWFWPFLGKTCVIKHEVVFKQNCLYRFGDADDFDVNKLFGRSFGFHHKNSVRFGWRPFKGKIAIFSYVYRNGERSINELGICDIDKKYTFQIKCKDNFTLFEMGDESHKTRFGVNTSGSPFGYKLYPYFGGNRKAPHDIDIRLD